MLIPSSSEVDLNMLSGLEGDEGLCIAKERKGEEGKESGEGKVLRL